MMVQKSVHTKLPWECLLHFRFLGPSWDLQVLNLQHMALEFLFYEMSKCPYPNHCFTASILGEGRQDKFLLYRYTAMYLINFKGSIFHYYEPVDNTINVNK